MEKIKTLEQFEIKKDYSCYRLSGHGSLEDAASKIIEAIAFAQEQGISRLLIDAMKWTGHASPSTVERYNWATAFTEVAQGKVKIALLIRPELMDPNKFEVLVATNRGMTGNVFDSEKDAIAWLLEPNI